jgi:hypothetical protein
MAPTACRHRHRPRRTDRIPVAARYRASAAVPSRTPSLRNAAPSWPHAPATRRLHISLPDQELAWTNLEAAPSKTAVHASMPPIGSETARAEPAIPSESTSPPTVAAGRDSASLRQNQ